MTKPVNDIEVSVVRDLLEYRSGDLWWLEQPRPKRPVDLSQPAGGIDPKGYRRIYIYGKSYKAHRLIWLHQYGEWPAHDIDHIDGDKLNNRIDNLREATHAENQHNTGASRNNTSGYKGVHWFKEKKKWQVRIQSSGKPLHLGYFDSAEAGHEAYREAAIRLHGEFARVR